MKHGSHGKSFRLGACLAILLVAAACTEAGPTASAEPLLYGALAFTGANGLINPAGATANAELFEVCKRWVGAAATADFSVDGGGGPIAFTDAGFTGPYTDGGVAGGHNDWQCADVWLDGGPANVAVTETGVSGGANPYTTTVVAAGFGAANVQVAGLTVSGNIQGAGGASGIVAFYTNTEEIPPPDVCEDGDRVTSVTLEVVAASSTPISIQPYEKHGQNAISVVVTDLVGDHTAAVLGTTFRVDPLGGAANFATQNLRFLVDGAESKDLKVHLSCSDDPMVGDTHTGGVKNGASTTLEKTALTTAPKAQKVKP